MPISVVLRKENREEISRSSHIYSPPEESRDEVRYPLLNGIDPHSDTIFNTWQMHFLLKEVEQLMQGSLGDEERASLEAVAQMCREGQRRVHWFLWFVGD